MRVPIASWILQDWQGPTSNVRFRISADSSFMARDNDNTGVEVDASPTVFREVDCTVGTATIDGITVKTITIPALWLFSNDDAIVNRRATYSAMFITKSGRELQQPQLLQSFRVYKDLINISNPVPWHEVIRANNPAAPIPADKETYSTTQILELIGLAGVGGGTGNVVAGPNASLNRVAFWTDPTTIDGSPRFIYDNAAARLTLGFPGSIKGKLSLTNASNANTQSIESADTPASAIVFKLPAADPSTGNSLRVASFGAGIAVLEWSNPPGGGGGGTGDVVGPGSATDNAIARFDLATGKIIQNSLVTLSDLGAFIFPDDVRQIFNPGANAAGLNVGAVAGDVATPLNGDLWYDSSNNLLRARINGATISLGAGGGGGTGDVVGPGSATDNAVARFDLATGKLIQNSLVTLSDLGAFTFPSNVRQSFVPGANNAGINVGSIAADPGTPLNGDLWYESSNNLLRARINGVTVSLSGGGSGDVVGPASATDNAIARYNLTTGKLIQDSTVLVADTSGAFTVPDGWNVTNASGVAAIMQAGTYAISIPTGTNLLPNSTVLAAQTQSSGVVASKRFQATYNQTGTAGSSDLTLVRVETAMGSGEHNFIRMLNGAAGATLAARWDRSGRIFQNQGFSDLNGNELIDFTVVAGAINQWNFGNSDAGNPITATAIGVDTDITVRVAPKGAGVFESTGPLTLSGTGTVNFLTPTATSVPTKINIPLFTPPGFAQIIAVGLNSAAPSTARVICVFDQRGAGHQPSIAVQAPDEQNIFGFTWDGQNSVGFMSSTTGLVGMLGTDAYFGNGQINAAPASMVLNATGGSGSNVAGGNLDLAGGKGTGLANPGLVCLRYPLVTTTGTTLQTLSSNRYPVNANLWTQVAGGAAITGTTTESSILNGTFAGTKTIEANMSKVGRTFDIYLTGDFNTSGSSSLTIRVKMGSTTVATLSIGTLTNIAARNWQIFVSAVPATLGVGGGYRVMAKFVYSAAAGAGSAVSQTTVFSTPTVDTTIAETIDVTAQWGTADASSIVTNHSHANIMR